MKDSDIMKTQCYLCNVSSRVYYGSDGLVKNEKKALLFDDITEANKTLRKLLKRKNAGDWTVLKRQTRRDGIVYISCNIGTGDRL